MKHTRNIIRTSAVFAALVVSTVSFGEAIHIEFEIIRTSGSRVEPQQVFEFWSQNDMIRLDYPPNPFNSIQWTLVANEHRAWSINQYNGKAVLRDGPTKRFDVRPLYSEHIVGIIHWSATEASEQMEIGRELEFFRSRGISATGTKVVDGVLCNEFRYEEGDAELTLRMRNDQPNVPKELEIINRGQVSRIRYLSYETLENLSLSVFGIDDFEVIGSNPKSGAIQYVRLRADAQVEHFAEVGIDSEFGDYNFDGNRDFRVFYMSNGRCPWHYYFLYQPATQSFKSDKTMMELCNPKFDAESKAIYTFHPGGHSSHIFTSNKYVWDDEKLLLEYQVKQTHVDNVGYRRVITHFEVVSDETRPFFPAGYNWNELPGEDP